MNEVVQFQVLFMRCLKIFPLFVFKRYSIALAKPGDMPADDRRRMFQIMGEDWNIFFGPSI